MISTGVLLSAFVAFLIAFFMQKWYRFRNLPPGPWGLPFWGVMPYLLWTRNPVKEFEKYKAKYGKVFSLTIGNYLCVVVNDYKLIQQAFKEDVFSGRVDFDVNVTRSHGKRRGIVFSEGKVWSEQRRFALKNLRNFGFGKHASMEGLLQNEAVELGTYFTASQGKPINLRNRFNASVLNSLWYLITGSRFELDDPDFLFLITNLIDNFQKAELVGLVFFWTWPLRKGLLIKGFWESFLDTRDRIQSIIRRTIEEHRAVYDPNEGPKDLIDALVDQSSKETDPNSSFYGTEGQINIVISVLDLFVAGAETSSSILQWAMLAMMNWPEIQVKVQDEIDQIVGKNRLPCFDDREHLLYTDAVMCEIHRYFSLIPLSIYHCTTSDTKLAGYRIPKGTIIMGNLRDAHHSKAYWGDPENFRPERFIDFSAKKLIKHQPFMPYSTGKRVCLGETLAKDTMFIFFTYIMQKFRVEKPPGVEKVSLEWNAPTFIVAPKPYDVIITPRC